MAESERQNEQAGDLAASLDGLLTETAKSIAANAVQEMRNANEIVGTLGEAVRAITHETGASASEVLKSAQELSQQSELLGGEAEKFLRGLRTA